MPVSLFAVNLHPSVIQFISFMYTLRSVSSRLQKTSFKFWWNSSITLLFDNSIFQVWNFMCEAKNRNWDIKFKFWNYDLDFWAMKSSCSVSLSYRSIEESWFMQTKLNGHDFFTKKEMRKFRFLKNDMKLLIERKSYPLSPPPSPRPQQS